MNKKRFSIILLIAFPFILIAQNVQFSGSITTNFSFPTINDFTHGLSKDDFKSPLNNDTLVGVYIIGIEDVYNQKRKMIGKLGGSVSANFHFNLFKKLKWRTGVELSYHRAIENIQTHVEVANHIIADSQFLLVDLRLVDKEVNRDIKLWSISMPVNLEYSIFKERLNLFSGINFMAIINQRDTNDDEWVEAWSNNPNYRLRLNYFTWQLNFGCEYRVIKDVYLRANFNHGMRNVFSGEYKPSSGSPLYQNRKSHWRSLSLGVTYLFF